MPARRQRPKPQRLNIPANPSLAACEHALLQVTAAPDTVDLSIAARYDASLLSELWTAVVIGTALRNNPSASVRGAGFSKLSPQSSIFTTLPGLVALQLGSISGSQAIEPVEPSQVFIPICGQQSGVIEAQTKAGSLVPNPFAHAQTLVECDPLYAHEQDRRVAPLVQQSAALLPLLLQTRHHLERLVREKGLTPSDTQNRDFLIRFVSEVHANSHAYSRHYRLGSKILPGIRILRLAVHIGRKSHLLEQSRGAPWLQTYIDKATISSRTGWTGVMQASVSDFGYGMLDHFLKSERGYGYRSRDRAVVLKQLIETRLSSRTESSAGLGLWNALVAARNIGALVSLRTAEFHLVQSFERPSTGPQARASPLLPFVDNVPRAFATGTHWQLFWPLVAV
jgi:hypothetical protein